MIISDPVQAAGCRLPPETAAGRDTDSGDRLKADHSDMEPLPVGCVAEKSTPAEIVAESRPTVRQIERALRDIGMARRDAENFTRAGMSAIQTQPDDEVTELRELLMRTSNLFKDIHK